MPTYVALLRGVNVGQNLLRMERLRDLCGEMGLKNARTYVQSGNLVFEAEKNTEHWCQALERRLAGETRLPVTVIVRTAAEIRKVLMANPFLKETGIDTTKLHVTFLKEVPEKSAVEAVGRIKAGPDRFKWIHREIYLHCPEGYGKTKLSNTAIEKVLEVRASTRNWNTVNKLDEMCRR